jgi:hypothetical protein
MESRRIPGRGIEHEQNYIEERMIDASNTDELAAQNEQLKDELRDLQGLTASRQSAEASEDALTTAADRPLDDGEMASEAATAASVGPVDVEQLPPSAEARARIQKDAGGNQMGT